MKRYLIIIFFVLIGNEYTCSGALQDIQDNLLLLNQNLRELSTMLAQLPIAVKPKPISVFASLFNDLKPHIEARDYKKIDLNKYADYIIEKVTQQNKDELFAVLEQLGKAADVVQDYLAISIMSKKPDYFKDIGAVILTENNPSVIVQHPQGTNIVVVGNYNGTLQILDWSKKSLIKEIEVTEKPIRSLAFNPKNNNIIAVGFLGKQTTNIKILELDDRFDSKEVAGLQHEDAVTSVVFNPQGTLLASTSDDAMVKLWNTQTWKEEATLGRHMGFGHTVSFNSDGSLLASAAFDGAVKLWNVATRTLLKTFIRAGASERTKFSRDYEISSALFAPTDPHILAMALYETKKKMKKLPYTMYKKINLSRNCRMILDQLMHSPLMIMASRLVRVVVRDLLRLGTSPQNLTLHFLGISMDFMLHNFAH